MAVEEQVSQVVTQSSDVFELVFNGPDVENGTMNARQFVEVVSGLQKAYSTVSHDEGLGDRYELRIRDIERNSIHLLFEAAAYVKANPIAAGVFVTGAGVAVTGMTNFSSGIYRVITDIAAVIGAKQKAKGERISTMPATFPEGAVIVQTPDGPLRLTKEQYELLLSRRLDKPLSQIVSPLEPNKIDNFQIRRSENELVRVEASQRDYFDYVEVIQEKTREGTQIEGTLNSLTKTNFRGTFYTSDGVHVPYRYIGDDLKQLYSGFSSNEPVRVHGKVKYGSDGYPTMIEVQYIEPLQRQLLN